MKPTKKLMLKKETLTELTTDQLRMVFGGGGDSNGCTSYGCSCVAASCNVINLTAQYTAAVAKYVTVDAC
jgi:natural product precursor